MSSFLFTIKNEDVNTYMPKVDKLISETKNIISVDKVQNLNTISITILFDSLESCSAFQRQLTENNIYFSIAPIS